MGDEPHWSDSVTTATYRQDKRNKTMGITGPKLHVRQFLRKKTAFVGKETFHQLDQPPLLAKCLCFQALHEAKTSAGNFVHPCFRVDLCPSTLRYVQTLLLQGREKTHVQCERADFSTSQSTAPDTRQKHFCRISNELSLFCLWRDDRKLNLLLCVHRFGHVEHGDRVRQQQPDLHRLTPQRHR